MRIGYCRVSTEKAEQDQSVEAQEQALIKAGCQKVLKERKSAYRPGVRRKQWEACKELIASGQVTHFMICSLARGSRQQENSDMSRLCKAHGVEFVVLDGTNADVSTPEGMLMVGIIDTVNRVDSTIKGLAVKRGNAARRAAGATACGKCPYGYRYNGIQPVPDPEQWESAKQLWAWLRDEEYVAARVLRLHPEVPFSDPGLRRWINNPILMGRTRYSDHQVKPLVSSEEWYKAQDIITQRNFGGVRGPRRIHLFSMAVKCAKCGRYLNYAWGGNKRRLKCLNTRCDYYGRGLAEWKVRDQVIAELRAAAPKMRAVAETTSDTMESDQTPEQKALQQRIDSLLMLKQSGATELDKAISAARFELESMTVRPKADWAELDLLVGQPTFLEDMTSRELRAIVAEFVEEIAYVGNPMKVKITMRDAT